MSSPRVSKSSSLGQHRADFYVPPLTDSVEVFTQPRTVPTSLLGALPSNAPSDPKLEPFLRHCIDIYTHDWTLISLRLAGTFNGGSVVSPVGSPVVSPIVSPIVSPVVSPRMPPQQQQQPPQQQQTNSIVGNSAVSNATTTTNGSSNTSLSSILPSGGELIFSESSVSQTKELATETSKRETDDLTAPKVYAELNVSVVDKLDRTYQLRRGDNVVGRSEQCYIYVPGKHLSKQHAVINILDDDVWTVMDLNSTNKTKLLRKKEEPERSVKDSSDRGEGAQEAEKVGGQEEEEEGEYEEIVLEGNVKYKLRDNDIIVFADIRSKFSTKKREREGDDKKMKKSHRTNSGKSKQLKERAKELKAKTPSVHKKSEHRRTVSEISSEASFLLDQSILLSSSNSSSRSLNVNLDALCVYKTPPASDKSIDRAFGHELPFPEKPCLALEVAWKEIKFTYGPTRTEPFFTSLTLYDSVKKERVSESFLFYFAPPFTSPTPFKQPRLEKSLSQGSNGGSVVNARKELRKINSNVFDSTSQLSTSPPSNPSTKVRSRKGSDIVISPKAAKTNCVFTFDSIAEHTPPSLPSATAANASSSSPPVLSSNSTFGSQQQLPLPQQNKDNVQGLYLVLRVGKLLKTEPDKDLASFLKPAAKESASEKGKVTEEHHGTGSSNSNMPNIKYFHVFAWSAVPLTEHMFSQTNSSVNTEIAFQLYSTPPSFSDEFIFQLLSNEKDFKRNQKNSIPADCVVSLKRSFDINKTKGIVLSNMALKSNGAMLSYVNILYLLPETIQLTIPSSGSSNKTPFHYLMQIKFKEDDTDPDGDGSIVFYARGSSEPKEKRAITCVSTHYVVDGKQVTLFLTDEIKMQLPYRLSPLHHLLISFFQVKPNPVKLREESLSLIGYSIVPLFINGRLIRAGSHKISMTEKLPPSYLSREAFNTIKYMDNSKVFATIRVKAVSSLYPEDENINNFFNNYDSVNLEASLQAIRALRNSLPTPLLNFFPAIFNLLFEVMCTSVSRDSAGREAFLSFLLLVQNVHTTTGTPQQLLSFVKYVFSESDVYTGSETTSGRKKIKEAFVYERICYYWQLLLCDKRLTSIDSFPIGLSWFLFDIIVKSMVLKIHKSGEITDFANRRGRFKEEVFVNIGKILQRLVGNPNVTLETSIHIGSFLKDLLSFSDPNFIYPLIDESLSGFSQHKDTRLASMLRLTFLRVILYHNDYLPLNMHSVPPLPSVYLDITPQYRKEHFLAGLLLQELSQVIIKGDSARRQQTIDTMRDLLRKHAFDPRYTEKPHKTQIFTIYFPFINLIVENYSNLKAVIESQSGYSWLMCFLQIMKQVDRAVLVLWWSKLPQNNLLSFFSIFEHLLKQFQNTELSTLTSLLTLDCVDSFVRDFSQELSQDGNLLLNHIFGLLSKMMQSDNEEFSILMYDKTLKYCVEKFGKNIFRILNSPFCEVLSFHSLRHLNFENTLLRSKSSAFFYLLIKKSFEEMGNISRMKLLSTVAISKLMGCISHSQSSSSRQHGFVFMIKSLEAIAEYASMNQKKRSRTSANNNQCKEKIGKHTGFGLPPEIALQVSELVTRLLSIIQNSTKISQNSADPEMLGDIYYNLMSSNVTSPDMRVAWLETLSLFHEQNGNWEEAGQCKILISWLIAQYLRRCKENQFLEKLGNIDLSKVAPSIVYETEITDENVTESEDAFQSDIWTLTGLIQLLEEAAELFASEECLESCIEVYEMLAVIQKKDKNFTAMIRCYDKLSELTKQLVEMGKKRDRVWPNYYRVAFYGSKFEDMNGQEFIYKEKAGTTLGQITSRIKKQLAHKYPSVEVIMLSNGVEVDTSTLLRKDEVLYTQIASVQAFPHEDSVTQFEQNFNINRFMFEMGITKDSQKNSSEDMRHQLKKKIIFNTFASFPHVKKRLQVQSKSTIVLSPIENAIELVKARNKALREVLETTPPNKTKLQQILSGSVTPMVNAGAVAICTSFLKVQESKQGGNESREDQIETLRRDLDYFLLLCAFAIKLHKSLVGSEQQLLHQQYEEKYAEMKSFVRKYTDVRENSLKFNELLDRKVRNSLMRASEQRRLTVLSNQPLPPSSIAVTARPTNRKSTSASSLLAQTIVTTQLPLLSSTSLPSTSSILSTASLPSTTSSSQLPVVSPIQSTWSSSVPLRSSIHPSHDDS